MSTRSRRLARSAAVLAGLGALVAAPASARASVRASAPLGSVHQVAGKDGCYTADGASESGAGACRNIRGGSQSTTIKMSPDGRFAYLVGYGSSVQSVPPVLSVFRRDRATGVLHQLSGTKGCFSRNGSSEQGKGTCTNARNLDSGDAASLAISADGRFLYVASQYQTKHPIGGIAIFRRNLTDGTLHQLSGKTGCVSATGESEDGAGTCTRAREVDEVSNLHLTPDQKYRYASNYDSQPHSGIAIFRRDARTGQLRQLPGVNGCLTTNGTTRQVSKPVCRAVPNLGEPWDVATPDNHFAYVPDKDDHLVQAFKRNAGGGLVPLTGKGRCVSDSGTSPMGACVDGRGLFDVERAVLSSDQRFIYTNSFDNPSPVAVLNRNLSTGALSQRAGTAACISQDGTSGDGEACRDGRALSGGYAGALTSRGTTLYFAEFGEDPTNQDTGLVIFRVSKSNGSFSQLAGASGCVTVDGSSEDGAATCGKGRAIGHAYQVAVVDRGAHVYVAASGEGVALFRAVH
ncbi:MAG: hypothetical protein ACTHKL_01665 [Streptosporangiaceae bacterium]